LAERGEGGRVGFLSERVGRRQERVKLPICSSFERVIDFSVEERERGWILLVQF
jgi:hypothetical protein